MSFQAKLTSEAKVISKNANVEFCYVYFPAIKKKTHWSFELGTLRLVSKYANRSASETVDWESDYYEYIVTAENIGATSGHKRVVKRTNQSLFLLI